MGDLINIVIEEDSIRYKILRPIGTWGPAFSLTTYEAAILDNNDTYISLVAISILRGGSVDLLSMAIRDIQDSTIFNNDPYILSYTKCFQRGLATLCIVLPYDTHVTSLRSLLSSNPRFVGGMDENLIALVLERVLRGLNEIHQSGRHHTRITADTIFYNFLETGVYLAYAASVYERISDVDIDDLIWLPVDKMLAWGAAPEVKHDESLEFVDVYETEKSDIWLIGIVALELAYGKILVADRAELLDIARYITSIPGALMDTWDQLKIMSAAFSAGGDPQELPNIMSEYRKRFSERFGDFVAKCLDVDPVNRPSAEELLNTHGFLKANGGSMKLLSGMVTGLNPHVVRCFDQDLGKERGTSSKISFRHDGITYTILKPIGRWGPENNLHVYEAVTTYGFSDPSPRRVAFKMSRDNGHEFFYIAKDSLERSTSVSHINILPLNTHFCTRLKQIPTLCMVLPFDAQVLSLRSIISSRPQFANGIPQNCIAVALLHAVKGLQVLHSKEEDHTEFTAGNIMYHIQEESIKLAFAASCYERTYVCPYHKPPEGPGECRINKLLSWGSPPEVDILDVFDQEPDKSDIWFIGIAALELAYGRIRVANRQELLNIASYISNVRKLPNTWEELKTVVAEAEITKNQPNKKFLKFPTALNKPQRFDECFGNFVAMCLDAELNVRPSASDLLHGDFLRNIHEAASMESFKAIVIKGYRDLNKNKAVVIG